MSAPPPQQQPSAEQYLSPIQSAGRRNESEQRLVCAVLAAQVAALRDRMDPSPVVDLLWRTTDILAKLVDLMADPAAAASSSPHAQADNICGTLSQLSRSLDDMAFIQAQRQDFARQIADCVVIALEKLAAETPSDSRLSADDLAALYVSDDQRALHAAVAQRFGAALQDGSPDLFGHSRSPPGREENPIGS